MKNNVTILFILRKNKTNRNNKTPLICRITLDKERQQFSTGLLVDANEWDSLKQRAKVKSTYNDDLNAKLDLIYHKINQAFMQLCISDKDFIAKDVYEVYLGKPINEVQQATIMQVYDKHNSMMEKLVGKDYSKSTLSKFKEGIKQLKMFLAHRYGKSDYPLESLNIGFLNEYEFYLKADLNQKQITINKSIQRLRKVVKLAIADGLLITDPFIMYKPKKVEINVIFLTTDELALLERYEFSQERLAEVRDCYIFCCYSGLPYLEMATLTKDNIIKGFDGNLWIEIYRQKTSKELSIPLLPKAKAILDKYESLGLETLLPIVSNQKFNSYIKEIAEILGIKKRLTHHTARKTFASTVLLYNNVSLEIVSTLLGHSKITVTQEHYGRVVKKKVSEEMKNLTERLGK